MPLAILIVLLGFLSGCGSGTGLPAPPRPLPDAGASRGPWLGEIHVKLAGCTSCADCRSGIRQIARTHGAPDRVDFRDGFARMRFAEPVLLQAGEIAAAIDAAQLRAHVDHVELRVGGTLRREGGGVRFLAHGTGQSWPAAGFEGEIPLDRPVVLTASLLDWAGPGASLKVMRLETLN